jgi:hypothetical protein
MSYIAGIDPTVLSSLDAGSGSYVPDFTLGQHGRDHDGKLYKYVKFNTGSGPVANVDQNVCYYYGAGGYQDHEVTMDLSDSVNIGAGIINGTPVNGQHGWIQIRGKATVTTALTAGSDGNALTAVGTTDGTLDVSALVTDVVVAFADDISAKEIICMFPE